jgi:hypothetical protein
MSQLLSETQIRQIIGNLEASIEKIEPMLDFEEFQNYCDDVASAVTQWRILLKKVKEQKTNEDVGN